MIYLKGIHRSLSGILFLGLLFAFSACREESPVSSSTDTAASKESTAKEAKPLVILTWDEYFAPEVISAFEKEHGISVEFVTFTNLDEMDGLLRSRPADFDLLVASGGVVGDLIELDFLQPLKREKLPQFGNLDQRFLGLNSDSANEYSVPYMWGTTLIAYRSDKIPDPERSWKSLWNEAYRGKVLMVDDGFDVYAAALLADGTDLNSQDPAHLAKATESLLTQVNEMDSRFVDIFEVREKLVSGKCWMSMSYSSDAAVLAEEEENVSYFIPEEGAPLWVDSFVIPRESTNSVAAHLFLDYFCRAEVAAANSNELWCASTNREARKHLSKEVLEDPTLYLSDEVMSRCRPEAQTSPERQLAVNQGLKKVFDRVRELEAKPRLSLLIWEEYLATEVVSAFETTYGAKLEVTEVENTEQLKQNLASRPADYDVVVADELTLLELIDLRLLRELESVPAPEGSSQITTFVSSPADPENRYSVPYLWGLTVLAGREEVLRDAEPSWNLLWRDDLRIAVLDEPSDLVWLGLLALGYDPANATREQVDEATARINKRFPNLATHMMDLMTGLDALEAGELDLFVTYNGDALARASQNEKIKVVLPREGAPIWVDSFAITRDAASPELARSFIDHMSRPENSAISSNTLLYASPNPAARAALDPVLLKNPVLYPDDSVLERCRFVIYPPDLENHIHQSILRLISDGRARNADDGTAAAKDPDFANSED